MPPGASLYGIGDLASLVSDTHKFESRYIEQLVAPFSSENIKVWNDRSPVKHLESFNCPVVLFQGDEDKVGVSRGLETDFAKKYSIYCHVMSQESIHYFHLRNV